MRKKTLAEVSLSPFLFAHLDLVFQNWRTDAFFSLREDARTAIVNNTLIQLVQETPTPCFLLPAILQFIELVNAESLLEVYSFCHFEAWLNRFSNLSFEENRLVRGKIMGRYLPRSFFDRLFPIGNKKIYPGSHYVTAHSSPDLDTLVASFWGWVDAFSAQVSSGLHIWNIPDGPPEQE